MKGKNSPKKKVNSRSKNNGGRVNRSRIFRWQESTKKWRSTLANKIPIVKQEREWLSLNHEAAHAVIGLVGELEVTEISIDRDSLLYTGAVQQEISPMQALLMRNNRMRKFHHLKTSMMCLAGPIYESILSGERISIHELESDNIDFEISRRSMKASFPKFRILHLVIIEAVIEKFLRDLLLEEKMQIMIRDLVECLASKRQLSLGTKELNEYRLRHLPVIWEVHANRILACIEALIIETKNYPAFKSKYRLQK